jgi:proteasome accessory factor C
MAKYSGPLQEVARALDLVPFLSTHVYISLKELAKDFEISEREMANELTALSMCGLPGYTPYELLDINFESGYVSIRNHEALDIPRALSGVEVATLLLGLGLMRDSISNNDLAMEEKIDSLFKKLSSISSAVIEIEAHPIAALISHIEDAISARRDIEFEYLSPSKDERSSRTVTPFRINFDNGYYYVDSYCHQARARRSFRLDRISDFQLLGKSDVSTPLPASSNEEVAEVDLHILQNQRRHSERLQIKQLPTSGKVRLPIYSSRWAERAIIAGAPDIKIVAPEALRQQISKTAAEILALYTSH